MEAIGTLPLRNLAGSSVPPSSSTICCTICWGSEGVVPTSLLFGGSVHSSVMFVGMLVVESLVQADE